MAPQARRASLHIPGRRALGVMAIAVAASGSSCGPPTIVLDAPVLDQRVGLTTTFRWHVERAGQGDVFRFELRLDKGVGACDDFIEEAFDAGTADCLTVDLTPNIYRGQRVEFGVRATDARGRRFCTAGVTFVVDEAVPAAQPCR